MGPIVLNTSANASPRVKMLYKRPHPLAVSSPVLATSCEELTHWKDFDAGRYWGQEEKGMTEDEMAGWHHGLDGHESE